MQVRVVHDLTTVSGTDWNRLQGTDNPFLRHEFLCALERHGAVAADLGWHPCHLLLESLDGTLLAAAPAYLKAHSRGEFVFDWSWADAYERAGGRYYPKLVLAVPLTPVTGARILHSSAVSPAVATQQLLGAATQLCEREGWSSAHCLFPEDVQAQLAGALGWRLREGAQFHWFNRGYQDFDQFLGELSSKKRKNIRRERRQVTDAGVSVTMQPASAVTEADWLAFHHCYQNTFAAHGNVAVISLACFLELAQTLADALLMAQARAPDGRLFAAALFLQSSDTLYGRYWGCLEDRPGVHFEACYYQGIDYCIAHGLTRFEPGAQGEHKIPRGFLPVPTWSAHWFAQRDFDAAIERFLARERTLVAGYRAELQVSGPYRSNHLPWETDSHHA